MYLTEQDVKRILSMITRRFDCAKEPEYEGKNHLKDFTALTIVFLAGFDAL